MSKGYEDLSRRALIQLDKDFDEDNDGLLIEYLVEHENRYENIRTSEKIIEGADRIKDSVSGAGRAIKNVLLGQAENVVGKVIGSLANVFAMEGEGMQLAEDPMINLDMEDNENE